MRDDKLPE